MDKNTQIVFAFAQSNSKRVSHAAVIYVRNIYNIGHKGEGFKNL